MSWDNLPDGTMSMRVTCDCGRKHHPLEDCECRTCSVCVDRFGQHPRIDEGEFFCDDCDACAEHCECGAAEAEADDDR